MRQNKMAPPEQALNLLSSQREKNPNTNKIAFFLEKNKEIKKTRYEPE